MKKAFISYRRQDSAGYVRAVHDRLIEHFDPGQIFMDVEDISPGTDFVAELEENLKGCTVMLVVIGPQWIDIRNSRGERRLDNSDDFVRLEVQQAIERGITVIPILVQGASMPTREQLPDDLDALSRRQALELDNKHFDNGIQKLIIALEYHLGKPGKTPAITQPIIGHRYRLPVLISMAGLLFVTMIAALIWFKPLLQNVNGQLDNNNHDRRIPREIAGFDCRQAITDIEEVICNDDRTRKADQHLNQIYRKVSRRLPPEANGQLRAQQLNWLKQRDAHVRQTCLTQANHRLIIQCIYNYYDQRISALSRKPGNLLSRVKLYDPPVNIRAEPNGPIVCGITEKQMIEVYIKAVKEADGDLWYWTQVCGDTHWGLIHESQISQVR